MDAAGQLARHMRAPHQLMLSVPNYQGTQPQTVLAAYWDDRKGLCHPVQHLAILGHRRVAYLVGARGEVKQPIVEHEASRLGLEVVSIPVAEEPDRMAAGIAMAREALRLRPRPTALIARHDEIAIGALHELHEVGIRVSGEVSLIGYLDIPTASSCYPPLTTVYIPYAECAIEVLEIALEHLASGSEVPLPARRMEFETRLVVRATTARPP